MLPKPDNNIDTSCFELKPRREAHRNTRECVCEETADDEVAKRSVTTVPRPEDPVKRRLMKKTDLRKDDLVMNVDADLLNTVNTLLSDETVTRDESLPRFRAAENVDDS